MSDKPKKPLRCVICAGKVTDWRIDFVEAERKSGFIVYWQIDLQGPACKDHRGFYFRTKDGDFLEPPSE